MGSYGAFWRSDEFFLKNFKIPNHASRALPYASSPLPLALHHLAAQRAGVVTDTEGAAPEAARGLQGFLASLGK